MFVVENWGWPQWAFVVIILLGIGLSAAFSGKEMKRGSFGASLLGKIIQTVILICGGFYQNIGWPQVVVIVLLVINLGLSYQLSGQKYKKSLLATLISDVVVMVLLVVGSFFA